MTKTKLPQQNAHQTWFQLVSSTSLLGFAKLFLVISFMFVSASICSASATNVYIAQASAGGATGADCADALPASWFNSSANWGAAAGKIGPGTTVHLCGTFTESAGASSTLAFQGSGTNGNPITLVFESGANATAPYWGANGFIYGNGQNYIIVNGGTNGTIQATANGSSLANQQTGSALTMDGSSNSEVKNLSILNMFVAVSGNSKNSIDVYGIHWQYGSNVTIDGNTLHDCRWCVYEAYAGSATTSNVQAFNNTIYNCDHGISYGDGDNGAVLNGTNLIYGNDINCGVLWDEAADADHHDPIHIWAVNGSSSTISDVKIYNNYLHGDPGIHSTAKLFIDAESGGTITAEIFNNVIVNTSSSNCEDDGMIFIDANNNSVYNNTLVGQITGNCSGGAASLDAISTYGTGTNVINNIVSTVNTYLYTQGGSFGTIRNNDVYNIGGSVVIFNPGSTYSSLASWQASAGVPDANSITTNPNLTASYALNAGSHAIGLGANLTSLGITALDSDKAGVVRPTSVSPWDAGAYQAGVLPNPPTALSATVQ